MIKLSFLPLVLLLISCGSIKNNCHLGGQTCQTLFGASDVDTSVRIDEALARIQATEASITSLQTQVNTQMTLINQQSATSQSLQSQLDLNVAYEQYLLSLINSNSGNISSLQTNLTLVQSNLTSLQGQLTVTNANVSNRQTQINQLIINLATLSNQDVVVQYIYPCGPRVGYFNEILLKTKSGKYLAYFESGSNRFLTELLFGRRYGLTDGSNCSFTIDNTGNIVNATR